jgi:ribosome maturation factor RimP
MTDSARLQTLIEPVVTAAGFALVRVSLSGGQNLVLQVMAEDPATGQMTLSQCATLSRKLSAMLDETDPIEDAYRLEVSSPGIDRPLTRLADFASWGGHLARVELAQGRVMNGAERKRFQGALAGVSGDDILLDAEGLGRISLPFSAIAQAKLLLTDALIAATVPLDAEDADEIEDEDDADETALQLRKDA